MASPTWGLLGTGVKGTGSLAPTPPTLTIGATPDIMYACHVSNNEAVTLTTANGFVEIPNSPQFIGTTGGVNAVRLSIFAKRAATITDPGPVFSACPAGAGAIILTAKGVALTAPLTHVTQGNHTPSASTSISVPSAETTLDECLVINVVGDHLDSGITRVDPATWASTNLAITDRSFYRANSVGNGCGLSFCSGTKATKGVYGPTTATAAGTPAVALQQGRITIAIAAAAAGGAVGSDFVCTGACDAPIGQPPPVGTPDHRHWHGADGVPWVSQQIVARNQGYAWMSAPINDISDRWRYISGTVAVERFYVRMDVLPTVDVVIARFEAASGGNSCDVLFRAATQDIVARIGTSVTAATAILPGKFYWLDLIGDVSASPRTLKMKVSGGAEVTASLAVAPTTFGRALLGSSIDVPATCRMFFTGIRLGSSGAAYPYGAAHNFAAWVGADGTHVYNAAGDFLYEDLSNVPLAVTDSWLRMIGPLSNTDTRLSRGTAIVTEYLEHLFAAAAIPATTVLNAIEVVSVHQGEDAAANAHTFRVLSGASTLDLTTAFNFPGLVPYTHSKHFVQDPTGVALTTALTQAWKFRFGFSATGTPSLAGFMIEGDCTLTSPPPDTNERNPVHTYAGPGSYTATLKVTDDSGLTDTVSHVVVIT